MSLQSKASANQMEDESAQKLDKLACDNDSLASPNNDDELSKRIKRVVRKIDMRLLPILSITYAFSLIDRVNLANVREIHLPLITEVRLT